nr:ABC transporter permease [Pseudoalteromonas sp. GCY]
MSLLSSYFIKPLNIQNESHFAVVEQRNLFTENSSAGYQSMQAMLDWYREEDLFETRALINSFSDVVDNLPGQPKLDITFASNDYYAMIKMPLAIGRHISPTEEINQKHSEVLISYELWQTYFSGKQSVLGESLSIIGRFYTIVGVTAQQFRDPHFLNQGKSQLWLPFSEDERYFGDQRGQYDAWSSRQRDLKLLAIVKPELKFSHITEKLQQQIISTQTEWKAAEPELVRIEPIVRSFREVEVGDKDKLAIIVMISITCLVLIAILNVSNLFISRSQAIQKQLALQAMLGAKRRLLFNNILFESLILTGASVLVALFLAAWEIQLVKSLTQGYLPLVDALSLDATVMISALTLTLSLAFLFAYITTRMINFEQLRHGAQSSGKGSTNQLNQTATRVLISIQLFFTTSLVLGASLILSKSTDTLLRPVGTEVQNMYSVMLHIPNDQTPFPERFGKIELFKQALMKVPNVQGVAHGESPLQESQRISAMRDMSGQLTPTMPIGNVGRDYFDLTGLELIEGRNFSESAIRGNTEEVIVTKAVNDLLKPDGSMIGDSYFGFNPDVPAEVVGISENFNHPSEFDKHQGKMIWWPALPLGYPYIVKMDQDKPLTREQVLKAIRSVHGNAGIWRFTNLSQAYNSVTYLERMTLILGFTLCGFTLLLCGVGIYGVLSYSFHNRKYEFGMRMALGAKKKQLYILLTCDTMGPIITAISTACLMVTGLYFGFADSLTDWMSVKISWLVPVITLLLLFAYVVAYYPMRKLIKSSPMKVLRQQ